MLTSGAQVGGYRIVRELGQGGMGTVYLAAHPTLPRHDALKVLSRELSRDSDFRTRFLREADVAARLDHPNIVSVYDRGQADDGQLWIAMQFVDGTDAAAALRVGAMSPERAVHVVTEVAKALDHAHARDVIHRDVKPANFLLSGAPGPDERVLLGDFGLARALGDVGLTATNTMLGTVAYSAPEVLANHPFDGRSDVYSLGCTLFRLLTGRAPFPGNNGMAAVMMAHLHQPPPRVTELRPDLPHGLDAVVAVAMAKDPAARFPTAGALAEAAAAVLRNPAAAPPLPIPPRPQAPPTVTPRPPRQRNRTVLVGALAAVVVLIAATAAVLGWPRDAASPAGPSNAGASNGGSSITATGPPATDVPPAALRSILLPASAVGDDGAGGPLILEHDGADLLDDSATVGAADCASAWAPAQTSTYADSGYSGAAVQVLRGFNKRIWQDSVIQAVVSFPPDPQRQSGLFLVRQQQAWGLCGGRHVVITPPGEAPQTWSFAQPTNVAGVLTLQATLDGGGGTCQRGIVVRGNVVIDVRQCRSGGSTDVADLVSRIADRVPKR